MSKLRKVRKLLAAEAKPLEETHTCPELAVALGKSPRHYRAIAVLDGSGTSWGSPTGSAAYLYLRETEEHTLLFSRASSGTSQTAELEAALQVLEHLHGLGYHKRENGCRVLFVTDSSLTEKTVNSIAKDFVKLYRDAAHPGIAAALLAFARRGFGMEVVRIRRNSSPVHAGVDEASRSSRLGKDPVEAYRCASSKPVKRKKRNDGEEISSQDRPSEPSGDATKELGGEARPKCKTRIVRRVRKVPDSNAAAADPTSDRTIGQ